MTNPLIPAEALSPARRLAEAEIAAEPLDSHADDPVARILYDELEAEMADLRQDYATLEAETDDLRRSRVEALQMVATLQAELAQTRPLDVPSEIQALREEIARLNAVVETQRRIIGNS